MSDVDRKDHPVGKYKMEWRGLGIYCDTFDELLRLAELLLLKHDEDEDQINRRRAYWRSKQRESRARRPLLVGENWKARFTGMVK